MARNGRSKEFVRAWKEQRPGTPVVAIASRDGVAGAVAAMQSGVADCLPQPIDPLRLTEPVGQGMRRNGRSERLSAHGNGSKNHRTEFVSMVSACAAMRKVFEQAELVAGTDSTILITGSTGTGKEVLANAIHRLSPRSHRPFVAVNVAAVPNTLIESELFGHVKGAFTDAAKDRMGRFEAS